MREKDDTTPERDERWTATLQIAIAGPRSPGPRGSSRRLSRSLSDGELAELNERVRDAAEAYLEEIDALESDAGAGWAEALTDGSWVWRIEG